MDYADDWQAKNSRQSWGFGSISGAAGAAPASSLTARLTAITKDNADLFEVRSVRSRRTEKSMRFSAKRSAYSDKPHGTR